MYANIRTYRLSEDEIDRVMHAIDETFDVGVDTRTAVDDFEYQVPFRFNDKIDKLTYKLGPEQLSAEDKEAAAKVLAAAKD